MTILTPIKTWARRALVAAPMMALGCTEISVGSLLPERQVIAPAVNVLALDFERVVFPRGSVASGAVAQRQKRVRIATPTAGRLRSGATGPIPTEVRLTVRRMTTSGGRVSVVGDLALRDLGLGKILAENAGFRASGAIVGGSQTMTGPVMRGIEDEIIAWVETLECNTATRRCAVAPPRVEMVDVDDAVSEGADINLAAMVESRPSGIRKINSKGIDASQVVAAATPVEEAPATPKPPTDRVPVGETVAALGLLDRSGFWLQTPLVNTEGTGVIQVKSSGKRLSVTLIPKAGPRGGGSQISLAAMSELGLEITDLVTLVVYQ